MKLRNILVLQMVLFTIFLSSVFAQFGQEEHQLDLDIKLSHSKINTGCELQVVFNVDIHKTWHINSDKPNDEFLIGTTIDLNSEDFSFTELLFPHAEEITFAFSDNPVSVFEGKIVVNGKIKISGNVKPGEYKVPVDFNYQACNNSSCMPPSTIEKEIIFTVVESENEVEEINNDSFSKTDKIVEPVTKKKNEDSISNTLEESGLIYSLIFVFLGGLALNLTPCVYPLIPITIGYFGGQSEGRTSKLFVLGLFYMLGMSITYSVVGVVTALSGAMFGALLQEPIVVICISLIFVVLALSMFGLFELKMPDKWVMKAGGAKSGSVGALFMGLTMGIVAAPCIGPFVLGLVTAVAAKGDPVYGFMMFFFLSIGLGTPYLFLAIFSGKIKNLPRAGFWMNAVKRIFGYILIGMALYFAGPLIPKEINFYVLPIFAIVVAVILLFIDKLANDRKGFRIFKIVFSVALIVVAAYMLWPTEKASPNWVKYEESLFENSVMNNKKIILDFYADWCIPCKEFDALTFSDARVIEKSKEFDNYKIDMTPKNDMTDQLRKKFKAFGVPTIIFLNSKGEEVDRLTGYVDANEFLKIMNSVN